MKISVIGGGIAGLAAGIYGQMNGFDTTIYEAGRVPGGVCAHWQRKGYTVNGSFHWLVGSGAQSTFYTMWRELGVIDGCTYHNPATLVTFRTVDGQTIEIPTHTDRLRARLLEISPEDSAVIQELVEAIDVFSRYSFPMDKPQELFSVFDWAHAVATNFPFLRLYMKYGALSLREFAAQFRSPILRELFGSFWVSEMAMPFFLIQWAAMNNNAAGYLLGGSKRFIELLRARYEALGGTLRLNSPVTAVVIEDDQAVGVRLADGTDAAADFVIGACDGHRLLYEMGVGKYADAATHQAYESLEPFPGLVFVSLGVRMEFPTVAASPLGLNLPLSDGVDVGGRIHHRVNCQIYNFDPTLAPAGCTLLTLMLDSDYDYWRALHDSDLYDYEVAQRQIAQALIAQLDKHFPGLAEAIAFHDVATPVTFERFTGNYRGSYEGWLATPAARMQKLPQHFPGLRNFYMAGHWVAPGGGMPPAAYTGRGALQLICNQLRQRFVTRIY